MAQPVGARGVLIRVLTMLSPLVLLAVVELGLRLAPGLDADQRIDVGPFSQIEEVTVDGVPSYRITHPSAYADRTLTFARDKAPDALRVFCLGGSASAGWPHPPLETYSAYLERALEKAYPDRRIEMINASAHGFASYRVRAVFDRVVEFDPDLVIVYSGNNEFLETRTYDTSAMARLLDRFPVKLRLVSLARRSLKRAVLSGSKLVGVSDVFWKKVKQQSLELRSDPEQFARVQAHYAESMTHMADAAAARGVPLVLLTVPTNLRDWLPNVSFDGLEGAAETAWADALRQGRRALLQQRWEEARGALERAVARNPEHAETHFWYAQSLERTGDAAGALAQYRLAKDLDYNPFRAHSAFNATVRELAAARPGRVVLVDAERAFEAAAPGGAPGFSLLLDYVHPTLAGNRILAREVFQAVRDAGVLPAPTGSRDFHTLAVSYDGRAYDERLNLDLQVTLCGLFCINHQYDAAIRCGQWIEELLRDHRDQVQGAAEIPAQAPPLVRAAVPVLTRYQVAVAKDLLQAGGAREELAVADADREDFYAEWFPYGRY